MADKIIAIRAEEINWDEILRRNALKIGNYDLPEACQQLEGEPGNWYTRFHRYMLMGPRRSLIAVFKNFELENIELGTRRRKESTTKEDLKPYKQVTPAWKERAEQFRWEERAAVFDRFTQQLDLSIWAERRSAWREKEWILSCRAYEVVTRVLEERWAERGRWSMKDLSAFMDSTSKLARSAIEMPAGLTIEAAVAHLTKYGYIVTDGRVEDPLAEQIHRMPDDLLIDDSFAVDSLAEETPQQ